jgi:hypothetical protein
MKICTSRTGTSTDKAMAQIWLYGSTFGLTYHSIMCFTAIFFFFNWRCLTAYMYLVNECSKHLWELKNRYRGPFLSGCMVLLGCSNCLSSWLLAWFYSFSGLRFSVWYLSLCKDSWLCSDASIKPWLIKIITWPLLNFVNENCTLEQS